MQKILKSILLFTAIIFIAGSGSSCKKYPDGPLISFHSKKLRVEGTWIVDYYSINGYDSTSYLHAQPYYGKYVFSPPQGDNPPFFTLVSNNNLYYAHGNWGFTNNKKDLNIRQEIDLFPPPQIYTTPYANTSCINPPYNCALAVDWEIRRLTDSDLWLKTIYSGKEYFMKLKCEK